MKRAPRDPEPVKRWRAFLENHREAIAAMDFFTVPPSHSPSSTVSLSSAMIARRILHFQHHEASDQQLDRPTIAGGVSVWSGSEISDP